MEIINELELRRLLKKRMSPSKLGTAIIKQILDESVPWEEKRSYWHYLYLSGREGLLAHAIAQCLRAKLRVPFDLFVKISGEAKVKPSPIAVEAMLKGIRKQDAREELIGVRHWDEYDTRIGQLRDKLLHQKTSEQKKFKDGLLEKFHFLQSQRMFEQAGRVLRRMVELYPDEQEFRRLKAEFEEQKARDVLSAHAASLGHEKFDRTLTVPSVLDEEMLKCFAMEGEKLCVQDREVAGDLAMAFWFLEDHARALDMLAWAPPSLAHDWLRADLLFASRRFIECIEHLNMLEIKYIQDPESTFAVSYLRAQCLRDSGQPAAALEILQSIVRVRPGYRSANALIQEWTEGVGWE